jgi:hypothetical protein
MKENAVLLWMSASAPQAVRPSDAAVSLKKFNVVFVAFKGINNFKTK